MKLTIYPKGLKPISFSFNYIYIICYFFKKINMEGVKKMELIVKKDFKDKKTNKLYKAKEIIKVSKERGEEMLKSPYCLVEMNTKKEEKDVQT